MDSDPVEGSEAFSRSYRTSAPDQPLSKTFRDIYWERVKEVLRDVFHGDVEEADSARKRLEEFQGEQSKPTQTLFYHADPFEVAADLAGARGREITPEEKALYQDLLQGIERPPPSHINATHPEDS